MYIMAQQITYFIMWTYNFLTNEKTAKGKKFRADQAFSSIKLKVLLTEY
jgi:hypothetical protein